MPVVGRGKVRLAAALAVAVTSLATGVTAAQAQDQDGLVNVAIVDTQVAIPVSIAANVCDVNVGVLAQQERVGGATCQATAESIATHNQGGGDNTPGQGGVEQDGLVNVAIVDTQVAVPVAVAANICDANVGVLARQLRIGETTCTADADSMATHGPGPGGGARTFPF
jgi:hypothetical protein